MKFKHYQNLKENLFRFSPEDNSLLNRYNDIAPRQLNPLVLAYVGDAYFHLYVRMRLLDFEQSHVHLLNDISMKLVSATFQAMAYDSIADEFTEDEAYIFKRGKNAKSHPPRVASVKDYHTSTGFEAVLGYLYLSKDFSRLDFICEKAFIVLAQKLMDNN